MGGGLMQLVAYGAQDVYLTGNPQITFFKVVYRRHTNFSMEAIEQTFNGTADFGKKVSATISRNGDLIHRVYLQATIPEQSSLQDASFRWLNWLGHVLIKNVDVEIGGQRIDKHYGDWLHIWNELSQTAGHKAGYANMVGNVPVLTQHTGGDSGAVVPETILYVPLQFWFCRNPGLALPLIALQYHEVKINLEFRASGECYSGTASSTTLGATSLYVDYIYLDTDERRRFAQVSHEYLIEQLQFTGDEAVSSTSNKIKLNFNHPCKELVWVCQLNANVDSNGNADNKGGQQWFNYTDRYDPTYLSGTPRDPLGGGLTGDSSIFDSLPLSGTAEQATTGGGSNGIVNAGSITFADLLYSDTNGYLNAFQNSWDPHAAGQASHNGMSVGLDAYPPRPSGEVTAWRSNFKYFDAGKNPIVNAKLQLNGHDRFSQREGRYFNLVQPYQHHENVPATGINVYSFGLKPEEHQPSGTCNFSRIDNAVLNITITAAAAVGSKVRVYAINYNVLRIMSGMGGLAYSN